ncbi:MAG: electron transfer flavoprotein subunit beta, partial [Chloroflexota bacterium]
KPIETWSLADIGVDASGVGSSAAWTETLDSSKPAERGGATFVRESADVAVGQIVDFLAGRRLI